MTQNRFKRKLLANEPTYGVGVRLMRTVDAAALCVALDADVMLVDMQHSTIDVDTANQLCMAALLAGVTPIVRPPSLEPGLIGRLIADGAQGLLVADVSDAETARAVVDAALLPPIGKRSIGTGLPHPLYGKVPPDERVSVTNRETLIIPMLESPQAIANAQDICDVPGIDAVCVGTNDLSLTLGVHRQFRSKAVLDAYRDVLRVCKPRGIPVIAGGLSAPDDFEAMADLGVSRCYIPGFDVHFLLKGASDSIAQCRELDLATHGAASRQGSA